MESKITCSHCGKASTKGYVFNKGQHHACSDKCRDQISNNEYQSSWFHLSMEFCEYNEEYFADKDFYYTHYI